MIHRVERRSVPLNGVGAPARLHVEEAYVRVLRLRYVALGSSRFVQHELHVRLTRAEPNLAERHIIIYEFFLVGANGERQSVLGALWAQRNLPVAVHVSLRRSRLHLGLQRTHTHRLLALLVLCAVRRLAFGGIGSSDAHGHSLARVGSAVYGKFAVALQHHVVRVGHGHL